MKNPRLLRGLLIAAWAIMVIALAAAWLVGRSAAQRFRLTGWGGSGATLEARQDGTGGLLFAPGIRYTDVPAGVPHEERRTDWEPDIARYQVVRSHALLES